MVTPTARRARLARASVQSATSDLPQRHRVVLGHRPLVRRREDAVQAAATAEGVSGCCCCTLNFRFISPRSVAQKSVGFLQSPDPCQVHALRQPPLPKSQSAARCDPAPAASRPESFRSPIPSGLVPPASATFLRRPRRVGRSSSERLTQVGRALKELGIEMIPAYSPQARGRSERRFGTWQGRLPQELRLAGIRTLEEANRFLRQHYIGEMNRKFSVPAAQPGNAFVPVRGQDLDRIFSLQHERAVAKDNTVRLGDRRWQIERTPWRGTLAGCRVTICEHLEGGVSIVYGPHVVGRYTAQGEPLGPVGKTPGGRRRAAEESVRPGAKALVPVAAGAWRSPGGAPSPWASPSASP